MNVETIREALRRQPFRAFTLRIADQRTIPVSHPDFVAVSKRLVVVINPEDDSTAMLEPLLITSLDYTGSDLFPSAPPTSNGNLTE